MKKESDWVGRPIYGADMARYRGMNERVNTHEALVALIDATGGAYRPAARMLGISHSGLIHAAGGKRPPPTLDTLAVYAKRVFDETGIKMTFSVGADGEFDFDIA